MAIHTEGATARSLLTSEKPTVEIVETVKPVEQPRTVTDLLLRRVEEAPDVDVLAYPATARGRDDYVNYTAKDLDRFADEAARKYAQAGLLPEVCIYSISLRPSPAPVILTMIRTQTQPKQRLSRFLPTQTSTM